VDKRANSRKGTQSTTPEGILAEQTPDVRVTAKQLRSLITGAVPDAIEAAYPGWRAIGYTHPEVGYFCAIFFQGDRAKLGFEFGVLLPDPGGLLEGTGKQVRYVVIRDGNAIPADGIRTLLLAAVGLPRERAVKLSLIASLAKPA
jgi:hypothetical protein